MDGETFLRSELAANPALVDALTVPVPVVPLRTTIDELTQQLLSMPQFDLAAATRHYFVESPLGRVYIRELRAPAGLAMVGKVHRYENFNVLVKGRVRMLNDSATGYEDIEGYLPISSPAGTQRGGIFLTDSIWLTICPTTAATVEEAEAQLVVDSYEAFDAIALTGGTT